MIRTVLARIRSFFEADEAKTVVRNRHADGLVELGRFEPVIPEKHFEWGWNTVKVRLEAGGEVRVYAGHPPYNSNAANDKLDKHLDD